MALAMRKASTKHSLRPSSLPKRFAMIVKIFVATVVLLQLTLIAAFSATHNVFLKKTFPSIQIKSEIVSGDDGPNTFHRHSAQFRTLRSVQLYLSATDIDEDNLTSETNSGAILSVEAHSGLSDEEFSLLISAVENAYAETVGLTGISCAVPDSASKPINTENDNEILVGTLRRVLSLRTNLDEESAECLRALIAEQMDHFIYESGELKQPVLVSVQNAGENSSESSIEAILTKEIEQYGLRTPVHSNHKNVGTKTDSMMYKPAFRIEIDGAETLIDEDSGETFWDTSSVVVFDNLISNDLRRRLLDVVKGKASGDDDWNDVENGPDPGRWVRGGLQDIPDSDEETNDEVLSCWGLPAEAIEDICLKQHEAINEFESILTNLFPQFVVSRLPEAVYGECVSPLTANAPVAGEESLYDYHIDGDPLQTPPSPWTDVYGRYPNRSRGKPRFVSCILYLNDEWDGEKWGAPTKFYDPPTDESCEVLPLPGRCVFLDQDLGHTVTPPKPSAGKRPRYSLVWKLILHPNTEQQDMTTLSESSALWPEPQLFGSAAATAK